MLFWEVYNGQYLNALTTLQKYDSLVGGVCNSRVKVCATHQAGLACDTGRYRYLQQTPNITVPQAACKASFINLLTLSHSFPQAEISGYTLLAGRKTPPEAVRLS